MRMRSPLRFRSNWIIIFLFSIALSSHAHAIFDTASITLNVTNQPLGVIFKLIERQTGFPFFYSSNTVDEKGMASIRVTKAPLSKVLDILLRGRNVAWIVRKDEIILRKAASPTAPINPESDSIPLVNVKGVVHNANGAPIAGVTVMLKGASRGQGTTDEGKFSIPNVPVNSTLIFSSIGFDSRQVRIYGQSDLQIVLDSVTREIEGIDVVSTGYQNIPKDRATGSFVNITNKVFNEQVGTSALSRLPTIASSVSINPRRSPESKYDMTIRGGSSFGLIGPLIVLDNYIYEGDLNNINPNDIENINVLRDAAATAIWGARAGNGVIVINTKRGVYNQAPRIEFASNLTVTEKPDLFYVPAISSKDFADLERFLFNHGHYDPYLEFAPYVYQTPVVDILERERKGEIATSEAERLINSIAKVDVRDQYKKWVYNNGKNQQYSINARGGGGNYSWFVSGGYDKNLSELSEKYERYNLKVDNNFKINAKLQAFLGVSYTNSKRVTGQSGYGTYFASTNVPPYTKFKDASGNHLPFSSLMRTAFLDTVGGGRLLDWHYYPLEDYKHNRANTNLNDLNIRVNLKYAVLPWLGLDVSYQTERQRSVTRHLYDKQSFFARDYINRFTNIDYTTGAIKYNFPPGGILDLTNVSINAATYRGQMNIDKAIGQGSLNGVLGTELREVSNEFSKNRLFGYNESLRSSVPVDFKTSYPQVLELFGTGVIPYGNSEFLSQTRFVSFYSTFSYTYDQRYTLSGSARSDASNLFGLSTRDKWNPLWSAGVSWNVANEIFYSSGYLPVLRVRATYGYSGNISPNASAVTTLSYTSPSVYTGNRATIANFKNSNLRWERVGMANIGIDFGFRRNVVSGSVEYYNKIAKDLLSHAPYDRTLGLGVATIPGNNGKYRGRGVDLILNTRNIDKAFKWSTNLLLSYHTDKVIEYYLPDTKAYNYVGGLYITKGFPRFPVFSYKFAGLDPQNGDPIGYVNGKESKNYAAMYGDSVSLYDLNFHGPATPKIFGSIGNTISFRNIDLTFRVMYQFGNYFLRKSIDYSSVTEGGMGHSDFSKRWQQPGDENFTNVPSLDYPADYLRSHFYMYSEPLISKADHIRLQYINASYTFRKNVHKWLPLKDLRIAFIANNVGILWRANKYGIDPLVTAYGDIPIPRNYSVALNVNL